SLAILTRSWYSLAISSRIGAIILQGPHHSAQKSRSTGLSDLRTSWAKVASLVCTMCGLLTRFNLRRMQSAKDVFFVLRRTWIWENGRGTGKVRARNTRQTVTLTREMSIELEPIRKKPAGKDPEPAGGGRWPAVLIRFVALPSPFCKAHQPFGATI